MIFNYVVGFIVEYKVVTLLIDCMPNANEQIFPLVFCIVDLENDSSW